MRAMPSPAPRCARARSAVSLFVDGELSELERAFLAAHLRDCEPCRAFEADVAGLTETLREAPLERPTRPVALPRRRDRSLRRLELGAAAALVALVGSVAGLVGSASLREQGRVAGNAGAAGVSDRELQHVREYRRMQLMTMTDVLKLDVHGRVPGMRGQVL